jgi:hypothetical protein
MNRRNTLFMFAVTAGLAGCGTSYSWRQKLTVTVDTPTGPKSGFAVVQVEIQYGRQFMSGNDVSPSVYGEATVVEVAPGKYLFAILNSPSSSWELYLPVWKDKLAGKPREQILSTIQSLREERDIPRESYPTLVAFNNTADPKTAREITINNLSSDFGSGYSLKFMRLEITNEPVTHSIGDYLPWLDSFGDTQLDGSQLIYPKSQRGFSNQLSVYSFRIKR